MYHVCNDEYRLSDALNDTRFDDALKEAGFLESRGSNWNLPVIRKEKLRVARQARVGEGCQRIIENLNIFNAHKDEAVSGNFKKNCL